MLKYASLLCICLTIGACHDDSEGTFDKTQNAQVGPREWRRTTLVKGAQSYQFDNRGVLLPDALLPEASEAERFEISHALPDGTALDVVRIGDTLYLVPDRTLADVVLPEQAAWAPGVVDPIPSTSCPTYGLVGWRLQQASSGPVTPLGASGNYLIGIAPDGGLAVLSGVCVNALHSPAHGGPYIYEGMNGEIGIAREFRNADGPQPVTLTTQLDSNWPICLQRIFRFMRQNWLMYSQGGLVTESGHISRPTTLVCAEADDPRLFIAPDRVFPRNITAYDPDDHRVLIRSELARLWREEWEALIETFVSWRNLGSHWIKVEGEKSRLLSQARIEFGWSEPLFPHAISQESNDHAWLHPAGYLTPSGSLTNGNGRLQLTFRARKAPEVLHLTLTAAANVHPITKEPPVFPGDDAGPDSFTYSDYPGYTVVDRPHGGQVSVPMDMTPFIWPD
jgi:hypothetical protein